MYSILFAVLLIDLGALILPGPDFAIVLRHSLVLGRKSGIACSLGIAIGCLVNALISFLIGSVLDKNFPFLYKLFITIGLVYLCYMGISLIKNFLILKDVKTQIDIEADNHLKDDKPFLTGFLTNLSNVKAIVFFNSMIPLVTKLTTPFKLAAWFNIGLMAFVWFSFVVFILSQQKIRNAFLAKIHIVELIVGIVLIIFALIIFYEAIV